MTMTGVLALWQAAEGVGLSAADGRPAIARYLERNPGMSFVAVRHRADRRGGAVRARWTAGGTCIIWLWHPSGGVAGSGRQLAECCLRALAAAGIDKCHLFVFGANELGAAFWKRIGWTRRVDLVVMSKACG